MEVPLALQLLEMNALLRFGAFAYVPAGDVIIFSHTLLGGETLDARGADHHHPRRRDHRRRVRRPHRRALRRPDHAGAARGERRRALPDRARQGPLQGLSRSRVGAVDDGRQEQHPRGDRQHADRQAQQGRRHVRRRHLRQVRVPEPGRLDEGSRRAATSSATPSGAGCSSPGGTIVEATSGNTGAGAGAGRRDPRLQVHLRHARQDVAGEDREPARVRRARSSSARPPSSPRIRAATTRSPSASSRRRRTAFYANQYHNPANPEAHYLSTAPEIWEQTRRRDRRLRRRHGHRRHDQRLRAVLQGEEARTSRSSASIRSARSTTTSSRPAA